MDQKPILPAVVAATGTAGLKVAQRLAVSHARQAFFARRDLSCLNVEAALLDALFAATRARLEGQDVEHLGRLLSAINFVLYGRWEHE